MKRPAHKWIFLVVVISALLATSAIADTLRTTTHQITASPDYETTPTLGWGYERNSQIKTDLVVYTLLPVLTGGALGPGDIWYQRLVDGAPSDAPVRVTYGSTDDQLNDVSGDYIVWTAYDSVASFTGSIVVFQISTGVVHTLGRADVIGEPKIHGNRVVWREGGVFASMVMYFDLSWLGQGADALVLAGPVPPTFDLQIGDHYAVWTELDAGSYDVYAYDFATAEVLPPITTTPAINEKHSATSGPWIVWQQQDGAIMTIEAINMDTNERVTVADNGAANFNPSIDGDLITWASDLRGNLDIWLYRISTGETFLVTDDPQDEYLNDVFGNMVAYVDPSSGNEDVFVSTLEFISAETPAVDCDQLTGRERGLCYAAQAVGCDEVDPSNPTQACQTLAEVYSDTTGGEEPPWIEIEYDVGIQVAIYVNGELQYFSDSELQVSYPDARATQDDSGVVHLSSMLCDTSGYEECYEFAAVRAVRAGEFPAGTVVNFSLHYIKGLPDPNVEAHCRLDRLPDYSTIVRTYTPIGSNGGDNIVRLEADELDGIVLHCEVSPFSWGW